MIVLCFCLKQLKSTQSAHLHTRKKTAIPLVSTGVCTYPQTHLDKSITTSSVVLFLNGTTHKRSRVIDVYVSTYWIRVTLFQEGMNKVIRFSVHLSKQLRDWPRSPNVNGLGVVLVVGLVAIKKDSNGFTHPSVLDSFGAYSVKWA